MEEQLTLIRDHVAANPTLKVGKLMEKYVAVSRARDPNPGPVELPHNNTATQLEYLDRMQESQETVRQGSPHRVFKKVLCRWNNTVQEIELEVNSLRAALNLPTFEANTNILRDEAEQFSEQNDIDHMEDEETFMDE